MAQQEGLHGRTTPWSRLKRHSPQGVSVSRQQLALLLLLSSSSSSYWLFLPCGTSIVHHARKKRRRSHQRTPLFSSRRTQSREMHTEATRTAKAGCLLCPFAFTDDRCCPVVAPNTDPAQLRSRALHRVAVNKSREDALQQCSTVCVDHILVETHVRPVGREQRFDLHSGCACGCELMAA